MLELKITNNLHWGKFFDANLVNLVLISSDCLPKYGKHIVSSFLGTVVTTLLAIKILSKKIFMQWSMKFSGKRFLRKVFFKKHTSV